MEYSTSDLSSLMGHLENASAKWRKIGLHLGLLHGQLDNIEANHPKDVERCLEEVLKIWLESDDETTQEVLALALTKAQLKRLALKLPEINGMEDKTDYLSRFFILGIFSVLCSILSYKIILYKDEPEHSWSLPDITEELFGRSSDLQEIMKHISRSDIQVFNLYGAPGMGKSTIAKHIGHTMLKEGVDVHYIKVEDLQGSNALKQQLMKITNNEVEKPLEEWAKNLKRPTLIILDNVDGIYWNKMRQDLRKNFVNVLQSYNKKIKILITSQIKILTLDKYYFYKLQAIDEENCAILLQNRTTETIISRSNATKICKLVGGVPLIIKLLSSVLRPPDGHQVDYVIKRLESSSMHSFIDTLGDVTSEPGVISALELIFKSLSTECSLFSLLLTRERQGFYQTGIIVTTAKNTMQKFTESDFYVEECIRKLTESSLLEANFFQGIKLYEFHIIVWSYLRNIQVNNKILLSAFWMQYLKKIEKAPHFYRTYIPKFTSEDVEVFIDLIQCSEYWNTVAILVLHNESFACKECPFQRLQAAALKVLNCPNPDLTAGRGEYILTPYQCHHLNGVGNLNSIGNITVQDRLALEFINTFSDEWRNSTFIPLLTTPIQVTCEVITGRGYTCMTGLSVLKYYSYDVPGLSNSTWFAYKIHFSNNVTCTCNNGIHQGVSHVTFSWTCKSVTFPSFKTLLKL